MTDDKDFLDIVFDGHPLHKSGGFVEVEDSSGRSVKIGKWVNRPDGYWALRIERKQLYEYFNSHEYFDRVKSKYLNS